MTTDRPLSEWKADLSAYEKQADRLLLCMKNYAAYIRHHDAKKHKRLFRKRIKQLHREYVELRSSVCLCESAISFHEAMLTHRPERKKPLLCAYGYDLFTSRNRIFAQRKEEK